MNKQKNKKYHHGDLRLALLDATVDMINQQGIESITMRRLSDWVGVSRTAAYRHFSDKADLLTATAIEGFSLFSRELKANRIDESKDQSHRFKAMGEAYIQFAIKNSAYYRLMFGDMVAQDNMLRESSDAAFNELLLMLQQLQKAKMIREDDLRLQAIYIWSLMHGLSSLIIDHKLDRADGLQSIMEYIDQMLKKSLAI